LRVEFELRSEQCGWKVAILLRIFREVTLMQVVPHWCGKRRIDAVLTAVKNFKLAGADLVWDADGGGCVELMQRNL
jgi:hypothetical protein